MMRLLLLLLFLPIVSSAQADSVQDIFFKYKYAVNDSAVRIVVLGRDSFEVHYYYNHDVYFDTLVGRMAFDKDGKYDSAATEKLYEENYHYCALVKIFKIKNGLVIKKYQPIDGTYVVAECFEDEPVEYVKMVIKKSK